MSVKNGEARPHAHHRERLKERFLKQGVDSLAPHEALELLLFYAIPQRDTNLLAHHLLERFGSLQAVLQASIGDLCAMPGVSRHTATLLHLILPLAATALTVPAQEQRPTFYAPAQAQEYLIHLFLGERQEAVYLLLLDNRLSLIERCRVHIGSINSVSLSPRRMIEVALEAQAASVILAHNHPTGLAIPSSEDVQTTVSLREAFSLIGVEMLEHYVVAGDTCTGILQHSRALFDALPGASHMAAAWRGRQ